MRKALCVGITTIVFVISYCAPECVSQSPRNEAQSVIRIKRLDVSKLDPGLPKQPFAAWLTNFVDSKSKITWEINDCGEQTGDSADKERNIPTCVQAEATTSSRWRIIVMIQIGTIKNGGLTKPVIKDAFIQRGNESITARSLSDLATLLKRTAAN